MNVRDIPDEWWKCISTARHAMDDYIPGPNEDRGPNYGRTFHNRCLLCTTTRRVTIDVMGQIVESRYDWPDGYREARKEARLEYSTDDMRLEHMRRVRAARKERDL